MTPRYPVYVISKGRSDCCVTARYFLRDEIDFVIAVEPQEADAYAVEFGRERLLVTPFSNLGQGSIPVRNFVWENSIAAGHKRHWVFDDNIKGFLTWRSGERLYCDGRPALCSLEDFADRYENLAIAGFNYNFIGATNRKAPFTLNCHVYSAILIENAIPYRWRGRYNEDTDLCLQVLSGGYCTALVHAFMAFKMPTMTLRGGNTDELYKGDGRLKMARSLERVWPGVVTVSRRWKRPQHVVDWARFDNRLVPSADAPAPREYPTKLVAVGDVRSAQLREMLGG